ncbi:Inactive rhomboid protein 2 [Manis javanica]|nr:Inactive rhomboid protein 2 [Manis javanica]
MGDTLGVFETCLQRQEETTEALDTVLRAKLRPFYIKRSDRLHGGGAGGQCGWSRGSRDARQMGPRSLCDNQDLLDRPWAPQPYLLPGLVSLASIATFCLMGTDAYQGLCKHLIGIITMTPGNKALLAFYR